MSSSVGESLNNNNNENQLILNGQKKISNSKDLDRKRKKMLNSNVDEYNENSCINEFIVKMLKCSGYRKNQQEQNQKKEKKNLNKKKKITDEIMPL